VFQIILASVSGQSVSTPCVPIFIEYLDRSKLHVRLRYTPEQYERNLSKGVGLTALSAIHGNGIERMR
jgi:hypothetical protein